MSNQETIANNTTQDAKLFSSIAIGGATFLGGPLAAAYMIGENFKALQKPKEGQMALIVGIVTTIALFTALFLIPESALDSIPRQIIPLTITAAAWGFVEWKMGSILKAHKEHGNPFFSGWRAAGIGFISLLIIILGIGAFVFFGPSDEVYEIYDNEMETFYVNEEETLVFYDHISTESNEVLLQELTAVTLPKWKENIAIIHKTKAIEDLPSELIDRNQQLLTYAELRVRAFELFKKAFAEDAEIYAPEIEKIHREIQKQLDLLNGN